ncbi:MAG: RagB/SusD family nutrient uptake outer membrane protein, partial [Bacteroidaceae bacterium]|nr:RagB/SusD family nutrient uptake outer membrane protein [Bacteroidaceae bacterium]
AECYYETGSRSKASNLLKELCQAKGVTEAVTLNSEAVLSDIAKLRKLYLYPFSTSFVRRHNLGISDWGMDASNLHNLLFPIPASEIGQNPYLTQNPGY